MSNCIVLGLIVDSDSQPWVNALVTATLVGYGSPQGTPTRISTPGQLVPTVVSFYLNDEGAIGPSSAGVELPRNDDIYPANTSWQFTIQPNASVPATFVGQQRLIEASDDLSSFFNDAIAAPRFQSLGFGRAYNEDEIEGPTLGDVYINTSGGSTGATLWTWDGTAWVEVGGGGGGGGVTGSGTSGFLSVWTGATSLGDSLVDEDVTSADTLTVTAPGAIAMTSVTGFNVADVSSFGISLTSDAGTNVEGTLGLNVATDNTLDFGVLIQPQGGGSDGNGPVISSLDGSHPIDLTNFANGICFLDSSLDVLTIQAGGHPTINFVDPSDHVFFDINYINGLNVTCSVGPLQLACVNGVNVSLDGGSTTRYGFAAVSQTSYGFPNREINTVYQNTTVQNMQVVVKILGDGVDIFFVSFYLGPTSTPPEISLQSNPSTNTGSSCSFIVPPGYFYKVNTDNGSLSSWYETLF